MADTSNRKRNKNKAEGDTSLWGFLFDKNTQGADITKTSFFAPGGEEESSDSEQEKPRNILHEIWQRFDFWSLLATVVFLAFTIILITTVISMWTPQNMSSIAGYADRGSARDLTAQLRNANGQPISFTESAKVTEERLKQSTKALSPTLVTPSWMSTLMILSA